MSNQDQTTLVEDQGKSTDQANQQDQTQSITKEQLDAILNERDKKYLAREEDLKNQLSGVNRKNSELQKTLEEKMTAEEKEAAEKQRILEEAKKAKEDLETYQRKLIITKELSNAELPGNFDEFITGKSEEEITKNIGRLKDYIEKLVVEKSERDVNKALSGKAPTKGDPVELDERSKLNKQYAEAMKKGDVKTALMIKQKLQKM